MLYVNNKLYRSMTLVRNPLRPKSDRNYLYFQSEEGEATVSLKVPSSWTGISFEVSTDGTAWSTWDSTTEGNYRVFSPVTLSDYGDYVFIRATGTNTWSAGTSNYLNFVLGGGKVSAGGSVMSLLSSTADGASLSGKNYCFYKLFYGCASLTRAPELPATTLEYYCYGYMFQNCTSLTSAPALPAMRLDADCYGYMFSGCTSLTTAPVLPATKMVGDCYRYMFQNCTALTTAPALPATTLANANYCYGYMFQGCTSLTTAPALPATTLASGCYEYMFQGCLRLNSVTVYAIEWITQYTTNWLSGVASSGTFRKLSTTTIPTGTSGVPSNWTIESLQ